MNIEGDIVTREYEDQDFDELLGDLLSEIELRNYSVTRINHIDNVLSQKERGLSSAMTFKRYKIVEFRNLNSCSEMLSSHRLSGVFMPARFIVHQGVDETGIHVSFLRPTSFAELFSSAGVKTIAVDLEKDMHDVLAELAS